MNEAAGVLNDAEKVGMIIMLLCNMDKQDGIANGTVLKTKHLPDNTIMRRCRVTSITRRQSSSCMDHVDEVLDPENYAVLLFQPACQGRPATWWACPTWGAGNGAACLKRSFSDSGGNISPAPSALSMTEAEVHSRGCRAREGIQKQHHVAICSIEWARVILHGRQTQQTAFRRDILTWTQRLPLPKSSLAGYPRGPYCPVISA